MLPPGHASGDRLHEYPVGSSPCACAQDATNFADNDSLNASLHQSFMVCDEPNPGAPLAEHAGVVPQVSSGLRQRAALSAR